MVMTSVLRDGRPYKTAATHGVKALAMRGGANVSPPYRRVPTRPYCSQERDFTNMKHASRLTHVRLGRTDLMVTRYCQGTAFRHLERNARHPRAERVLRHCLDVGVNFFDSAQEYGWGASEELLGSVLAGRREGAVNRRRIASGARNPMGQDERRRSVDSFQDALLDQPLQNQRFAKRGLEQAIAPPPGQCGLWRRIRCG